MKLDLFGNTVSDTWQLWMIKKMFQIHRESPELDFLKMNEMKDADIKLKLIRLINSQKGALLHELYPIVANKRYKEKSRKESLPVIELGYKELSEDKEREEDAVEWIEGTLNSEGL